MGFNFNQNSLGNLTVVDKVPQDMMYLVDSHWYQYPPMNPLWHSILGFALAVFCVIAYIGNLVVIYVFTKSKSLRSPSNLLVVNLAVSDFMIMFTMGPPMVSHS
jgi:r-opsin